MASPALEAIQIEKTYPGPVRALAGVDLAVLAGETMVLVGESGSGKTTLLRMFNRMAEPSSGVARIRGRDAGDWDPIQLRRSIGYVQQEGGLLPHWTVGENVDLVPRLLGWDADRRKHQVNTLLFLVGLDPIRHRDRYPVELSGGQRQRVAFARALAADPDVLLMDEPFGALDAITRVDLRTEFLEIKGQLGKTMVLVTHDLNEAFRLGDRISVMKDGKILQTGTAEELESAPTHRYVRDLLDHREGPA
jgi:osmoprotectant transport system ATP-binding protein